jgi:Tfp pilus assembly protein PilO
MASSSIITEFGRKPPLVKVGVFVAIGLVLGALYWQLVYSGLRKDVQAAEDTKGALVADEQKLTKDEKEFTQLKEKQDVLETMIKENDNALPTAAQLPSFFDMLNRKVGEAGVDVRRWIYLKEVQVEETIFKVPVEIEIQGTFYEIKKFFHLLYRLNLTDRQAAEEIGESPETAADVEERDRILTIEDLELGSPAVRNNELTLTATFRASTFRKEVPEAELPPADDKKAKAGAAKASSKNPVQQAKDKTEDAMEKSDDRARKAGGADSPVPAEKEGAERVKGGM